MWEERKSVMNSNTKWLYSLLQCLYGAHDRGILGCFASVSEEKTNIKEGDCSLLRSPRRVTVGYSSELLLCSPTIAASPDPRTMCPCSPVIKHGRYNKKER